MASHDPDYDDPFDWTIEDVVEQFCRNPRPAWSPDKPPKYLESADALEKALRDNDVDGETLLDIDDQTLKSDLGITSFGQRRAILRAIQFLRSSSRKTERAGFQADAIARHISTTGAFATPQITGSHLSGLVHSPFQNVTAYPHQLQQHQPAVSSMSPNLDRGFEMARQTTPTAQSKLQLPQASSMPNPGKGILPPDPQWNDESQQTLPAMNETECAQGQPQRRPAPGKGPGVVGNSAQDSDVGKSTVLPSATNEQVPVLDAPEARNDKILVDSRHSGEKTGQSPHGLADLNEKDKLQINKVQKRVVPTFVHHISEQRMLAYRVQQARTGDSPDEPRKAGSYFLNDALPVEDIFYPTPEDESDGMNVISSLHPPGLQKFIGKTIKSFLLQPVLTLPNGRTKFRIPYKRSLCLSRSNHYFTIFPPFLPPAVRSIDEWPAVKSQLTARHRGATETPQYSRSQIKSSENLDPFQVPELGNEDNLDDFDMLLKKYPPNQDDNADLLPLYGDSGDEGEYDEETWEEMRNEMEENRKMSGQTHLSKEDISKLIDQAILEQEVLWKATKLAKFQVKAYRLWKKATREGKREAEIDTASYWINRFSSRLAKVREAILKDLWHNPAEVKLQCQSFEESVYQREEQRYLMAVLNEPEPPAKPSATEVFRVAQRAPRPDLAPGEEILESDSDLSMKDFIVDNSSDAESIPYDVQRPSSIEPAEVAGNVSSSLQDQIFEESRTGQDQTAQEKDVVSSPPQEATLMLDEVRALPVTPAHLDFESDSSEDRIVSSADRLTRKIRNGNMYRKSQSSTFEEPLGHGNFKQIVAAPESESEQDSDLDRPPPLPKTRYRYKGASKSQAIDLTFSSSPSRVGNNEDDSVTDFDIHTPDLNAPEEVTMPIKLKFRSSNPPSPPSSKTSSRIHLSTSSQSGLPNLEDVDGIKLVDWDIIEEGSDRRRALAKAVYEMDLPTAQQLRIKVLEWIRDMEKAKAALQRALMRLNKGKEKEKFSKLLPKRALSLLFLTFVHHTDLMDQTSVSPEDINEAFDKCNSAHLAFFNTLTLVLNAFCVMNIPKRGKKRKIELEDSPSELGGDSDILMHSEGMEDLEHAPPSSHKKRKRAVAESQEAKFQQLDDRVRIKEQERRKALMMSRFQEMTTTNDGSAPPIINTQEPYIQLDPHIGQRVKPHQVEGISFMWREIVEDPKQQGCLLAHTMGLGKTMQVIALLYTIAQCGKSGDPAIRNQVPESLRRIRALVLCPPSLVNNWFDELHMWVPDHSTIGPVWVMPSTAQGRLRTIGRWMVSGGVLLIGYEMFRDLIAPKSTKKSSKYTDEDRKQLEDHLLNGPNVIIADEAHKLKNTKSKIGNVAQRFKTLSRIALTGSPLNNHLEEYHTMIDWIAPGYLGDLIQFKDKYSEPIMAGLYADSNRYERRLAMKKLHVLKRDLDPKINRADISAVEQDMPVKTEYFITIPLTELQSQAYNIFVNHILKSPGRNMARLWGWLSILGLLCNHPSCFVARLIRQINDLKQAAIASSSHLVPEIINKVTTEEQNLSTGGPSDAPTPEALSPASAAPEDPPLTQLGIPEHVLQQAVDVFEDLAQDGLLHEPGLSYRTELVQQIIEESIHVGDKVLLFSHSIPTLDYLQRMLEKMSCGVARIDGNTAVSTRQGLTKSFNQDQGGQQVFLISMRAGGLGLNLQGANRVIIFDFSWNPTWEEQAIGRAYRLGQQKPVFVYRFRAGGSFENVLYNKSVFKTQLFQRVVDKKNYKGMASKSVTDYIFPVQDVPLEDFTEHIGKDPAVLDQVIDRMNCIRNIQLTETFQREEDEELTAEERKAADEEYRDQVLLREDPVAYYKKQRETTQMLAKHQQDLLGSSTPVHEKVNQLLTGIRPSQTSIPQANIPRSQTSNATGFTFPQHEMLKKLSVSQFPDLLINPVSFQTLQARAKSQEPEMTTPQVEPPLRASTPAALPMPTDNLNSSSTNQPSDVENQNPLPSSFSRCGMQ